MENKERIEEIKEELERLENLGDYETEEYDDMLDDVGWECYSNSYSCSVILKAVDEIVYNMGKLDYYGEKTYELEEELKELESQLNTDSRAKPLLSLTGDGGTS